METNPKTDATYVMGRTERETDRLQQQARLYDPFLRHCLVDAGLAEGMHVLDVGCGAGDVSFLAADLVGSGGTVLGIDLNPSVLETARGRAEAAHRTNVRFVVGDFREVNLPLDVDAVIGRNVLFYQRDAAEGIRRACRQLRPNGVVAFAEPDFTEGLNATPRSTEFARVRQWAWSGFSRAGAEPGMGHKLRQAFVEAGLHAPQTVLFSPMGGGPDWVGYAYTADSIRSMLPWLLEYGIATEAEVDIDTLADRLRDEVVSQNGTATLYNQVVAWTRKT